jgi:hypothetical protein
MVMMRPNWKTDGMANKVSTAALAGHGSFTLHVEPDTVLPSSTLLLSSERKPLSKAYPCHAADRDAWHGSTTKKNTTDPNTLPLSAAHHISQSGCFYNNYLNLYT